MRQRWAVASGSSNPYIVNWSVDVQDWLWAETSTPEKQLDAFKANVAAGGDLVVMHYLYASTVRLPLSCVCLSLCSSRFRIYSNSSR